VTWRRKGRVKTGDSNQASNQIPLFEEIGLPLCVPGVLCQHSNYRNTRRRRQKKKSREQILEEIIIKNFPKMGKEIATQVQEIQRVQNRINPRQNTPRHILIKLAR